MLLLKLQVIVHYKTVIKVHQHYGYTRMCMDRVSKMVTKIEKKVIIQYSGVSLVLYSLLLPHNPTEG